MVFSATTKGAEDWKAIISAISTLVEEATFEATVEGITFRGMDPSHVWHLYVIRTKDRKSLQAFLKDHNIETLIHYPIAPHHQQAYKSMKHLTFPVSEKIHEEVLSLPISPFLSEESAHRVADVINKWKI